MEPPSEEEGGFWDGLSAAADWFLRRGEGEAQHERTWGVVPLVVAGSDRGFGGGVLFVEKDLFGLGVRLGLEGIASSNEFYEPEATLEGPTGADGFAWRLLARYRSRPRLNYYGLTNRALRRDRSSLALEDTRAEVWLGGKLNAHIGLFGIGRFENVNARDGDSLRIPKLSARHDVTALRGWRSEGLTNGIGAGLVLDARDRDFNPSRGFRAEIVAMYHGPELGDRPFRFGFYAVDLAGYVPIFGEDLVLALHGRVESVDASLDTIPFYALPSLGGSRTLRGYFEGRRRDRHAVLLQAELRFPVWGVLAGGVFVDAGRVYSDLFDPLDEPYLSHFLATGGAGLRFVIHPDILVRLDVGASTEEVLFWLAFGHAF